MSWYKTCYKTWCETCYDLLWDLVWLGTRLGMNWYDLVRLISYHWWSQAKLFFSLVVHFLKVPSFAKSYQSESANFIKKSNLRSSLNSKTLHIRWLQKKKAATNTTEAKAQCVSSIPLKYKRARLEWRAPSLLDPHASILRPTHSGIHISKH